VHGKQQGCWLSRAFLVMPDSIRHPENPLDSGFRRNGGLQSVNISKVANESISLAP